MMKGWGLLLFFVAAVIASASAFSFSTSTTT